MSCGSGLRRLILRLCTLICLPRRPSALQFSKHAEYDDSPPPACSPRVLLPTCSQSLASTFADVRLGRALQGVSSAEFLEAARAAYYARSNSVGSGLDPGGGSGGAPSSSSSSRGGVGGGSSTARRFLYLLAVGVVPGYQRRGLGSALLAALLRKADHDGCACYAEATSGASRELLRRHGFNELLIYQPAPSIPPVHVLVRPPQGAAAAAGEGDS